MIVSPTTPARILITGVTGFVGGYLAEALLDSGANPITGWSRGDTWPKELIHLQDRIRLQSIRWNDSEQLYAQLMELQPTQIYHLAGFASPGQSTRFPEETWFANLESTRRLYDAVLRAKLNPRILFVSSGLIYGEPDIIGQACDERTTLKPATPYAVSKCAADLLGYQYYRQFGLQVIRARPFNHTGARQSAQYALPNFARQVAAIDLGIAPPVVETGDLSAERDLLDVRDVVTAYLLLMQQGEAGEAYNVASGQAYSMEAVLRQMIQLVDKPIDVRQKIDPHRKGDTSRTVGDARKLHHATGWAPSHPISETLNCLLKEWREIARSSS